MFGGGRASINTGRPLGPAPVGAGLGSKHAAGAATCVGQNGTDTHPFDWALASCGDCNLQDEKPGPFGWRW
eukprot:11225906-Lingulodinium_polyedra.AAC.1